MNKETILAKIKSLHLPENSYVVFGSCPLAIAGIRESKDIDLLVSKKQLLEFKKAGWPELIKGPNDIPLVHDVFEAHDNWNFSSYNPSLEELLAHATLVDGIPFASLEDVRKWKISSGRPKDLVDIQLIDEYNKQHQVIITSYIDPDLDGTACAFAYAELLNKTGHTASIRFFGNRNVEAVFLLEKFNITIEEDYTTPLDRVILVDASELRDLDNIQPEHVIEVIDHRKINDASTFTNAKIQIEFVGAAATLIAERFQQQNIPISSQAALLLYGAIISNTLNFRVPSTTERDRTMAAWLETQFTKTPDFVESMFRAKSDMTGNKLAERIISDFAWFPIGGQKVGIAQLEIMGVAEIITHRLSELLTILEKLRQDEKLDHIFISFIDLEAEHNVFCTDDVYLQEVLSKLLNITFENNVATRKGYIMRKEIAPLLKSHSEYFPKR